MIPLIFTPMSYPVYLGAANALNIAIPIAFLKFSRGAEAEADMLGLQYMYKAGYDPSAYVSFFSKIIEPRQQDAAAGVAFLGGQRAEEMVDRHPHPLAVGGLPQ